MDGYQATDMAQVGNRARRKWSSGDGGGMGTISAGAMFVYTIWNDYYLCLRLLLGDMQVVGVGRYRAPDIMVLFICYCFLQMFKLSSTL